MTRYKLKYMLNIQIQYYLLKV